MIRYFIHIFLLQLLFWPITLLAQQDSVKQGIQEFENPELNWNLGKKLSFHGQFGFRMEYMHNERFAETDSVSEDDHRYRERVRLRFGAEFRPNKNVEAGFRITTGQSNYPASGWSSFSDGFARDPVSFDRVYLNYYFGKFALLFGAQENPHFHPTDLIWDEDVQPAGISQQFLSGKWKVTLSQFMINEYRDVNPDKVAASYLFVNSVSFAPSSNFKVSAFQYYYTNADVIALAIDTGLLDSDFKTNRLRVDDPQRFFSKFHSLGFNIFYTWGNWRLVGEAAINISAKSDPDLGRAYSEKENMTLGFLLRYGKLKKTGDVSVESGLMYVEADAVIAAYNSDDYQQTNVGCIPIFLRIRLPGQSTLIWDSYFQKRLSTEHFVSGGILHDENALKIRSRITLQLGF